MMLSRINMKISVGGCIFQYHPDFEFPLICDNSVFSPHPATTVDIVLI